MNANKVQGVNGTSVTNSWLERGIRAPEALWQQKAITLKIENVSAREAACAIISASSLPISFQIMHNKYIDTISLEMPVEEDVNMNDQKLSPSETEYWIGEITDSKTP